MLFWQLIGSIVLGKPQRQISFHIILWVQGNGWTFARRKGQNCIFSLNLILYRECWHTAKAGEILKWIHQALFLSGFWFTSLFPNKDKPCPLSYCNVLTFVCSFKELSTMWELPPCKLSHPSDGDGLFLWKHFHIWITLSMLLLNGSTAKTSLARSENALANLSTRASTLKKMINKPKTVREIWIEQRR